MSEIVLFCFNPKRKFDMLDVSVTASVSTKTNELNPTSAASILVDSKIVPRLVPILLHYKT